MDNQAKNQEVFIVKAYRGPQVKSGGLLKDVAAPFLGHYLIRQMMDETGLPNDRIDEVIIGNTGTPAKYPNVGRVVGLEAGLDKKTSGYSVHRNCASGLEAVSQGFLKIASGRANLIFAGGVESMSQMPLMFGKEMTDLFIKLMGTKSSTGKLKILGQFRPHFLNPVIAIEQGLTDPFCGLNMGQTAEVLAREFKISREDQDRFANESHARAIAAQKEGRFDAEILPLVAGPSLSTLVTKDIGPREQSSLESLAKLKPFFERETGTVTVGNSCPITDGGSMLLLASQKAVEEYKLEPLGKIKDFHFHGLEPERMGMGPLLATAGVLKRTGLTPADMDLVELNEAFAAQVLAVLMAMKDDTLAQRFGLDKAPGEIPLEKLNVNGGGIALGHPVGSTGSRLIVTLIHELKKRKLKTGLATLCIGGGQGGAAVIETV